MRGAEHLHIVDVIESLRQHLVGRERVQLVDRTRRRQQHRADNDGGVGIDLRRLAELTPGHFQVAFGHGFHGFGNLVERRGDEDPDVAVGDLFFNTLLQSFHGDRCRVRQTCRVRGEADRNLGVGT